MKRLQRIILSAVLIMAFIITSLGLTEIKVSSIKLNINNVVLQVGKTIVLKGIFTPKNATNKKLTFSSSNKKIASVDKNGTVKGIVSGKAVITVTSTSNKKAMAKCNVSVVQNPFKEHMTISWQNQCDFPKTRTELVKYMEEKFNVTFKFRSTPNYWEALNLALAANDMPDMIGTVRGGGMPDIKEYGLATFTMDEFTKYMPKYYDYLRGYSLNIEKYLKSVGNSKGEINTIPTVWEQATVPRGLVWRKDKLDQLGVQIPTTIDEATNVFKLAKKKWPKEYPYQGMAGRQMGNSTYLVTGAFGGVHSGVWLLENPKLYKDQLSATAKQVLNPWLDKSKALIYGGVHPRAKDALAVLRDWQAQGFIDPEWVTYDFNKVTNEHFYTGEGLVNDWVNTEPFSEEIQFTDRGVKNFKLEMGPWLKTKYSPTVKSMHYAFPANTIGAGGGVGFGIQLQKDRAKMYRIMQIMEAGSMDEEVSSRIYWGKEGEFWKKKSNGFREFLPNKGIYTQAQYDEGMGYALAPLSTPVPARYNESVVNKNKWINIYHGPGKVYEWTLENIIEEAIFSKVPPGKTLKNEKGENMDYPDLANLATSAYIAIITGEEPLSYFDTYVERWYKEGGTQMTKAMNEQFLEYWLNWTQY